MATATIAGGLPVLELERTASRATHNGGPGTFDESGDKHVSEFVENTQHASSSQQATAPLPAYMSYSLPQTARAFWRCCMFVVMVAMGAMYDAYVTSVPQNLLANEGFVLQMATLTVQGVPTIAPTAITIWGVMYTVGGLVAMCGSPWISDRFGRKISLWLLTVCLVGDAVMGLVSKNWHQFCVARFFSGLASGLLQTGVTSYIAEVAPVKIRGALLVQYAIFFAVGGLLGTVTLNEIANYAPLNYKIAFYSEFGVLALFLPGVVLAPETPMFYARKGQEAKAKRSMRWLYATEPSYNFDDEYNKLVVLVNEERESASNVSSLKQYKECFKGTNLRRTIISFIPLLMQQMSGLVVFLGYCSYFFQLAGYAKPFQASVIIQCILLAFVIVAVFSLDKVGRRPLLLGGVFIIVICNFALGALGFLTKPPGVAMIFVSCLWAAAYSVSLGPMAWTYVSETAAAPLRTKTVGLATAMTVAFNLIWSYTIPLMLSPAADNWGLKTTFLYGSLSAIFGVALFFLVPEIKGRTFAELDEMFEARVPTRQFAKYRTQLQIDAEVAAEREMARDAASIDSKH